MPATAFAAPEALEIAAAGTSGAPLSEVEVFAATPLPGVPTDLDKIPGNVQVLSAADLSRQGSPSITTALSALGSVNVNDDLDDPFQPDILYRGFEASPVLGTPQGLAVYQNGVRINEAFGDTVNWDLFPDIAIRQVELVSSNPLYGLNALGGAVSVTMKDGYSYQGANIELSGGAYNQRSAVAQVGANSGSFAFYAAGRTLDWDGWRQFSGDRIRTIYAAVSWHPERATLDLSYTGANNQMNGQGPAPTQELAVNRSLVFTGPQENINNLAFFTLNGTLHLSSAWSMQGVAYYRQYSQRVSNGNTTNYVACRAIPGTLCQPDGVTPLTNASGQTLPDISDGGSLPIGENDLERIQAWGRGITLQISSDDPLLRHENHLSIGAALDYASASFYSGAELGLVDSQLMIAPSDLIIDTPENSAGALANGDAVPVGVDSVNKTLSAYLTDTFNVTSNLAITTSARYNITHIELADQFGSNLSGDNRFAHFNPAIGATYKILPIVTAYGGWSTNNRTPTASEIECSNPLTPCLLPSNLAGDPPILRQVISHTLELGFRGRIASPTSETTALSWNASVFRTVLHDDIYGVATSVSQGFFQNIGDTRRQGFELGFNYSVERWSGYLNYSLVEATFESALVVPSPSNPYANTLGDIQVVPGDGLPGIPRHRLKLGADFRITTNIRIGATVSAVSNAYFVGDESNQLAPIPGYTIAGIHANYRPVSHMELFASINNLLNRKYSTWGILSDPTGVGAPGIPANGVSNGPGVNNRFLSPASPFEAFAGVRLTF